MKKKYLVWGAIATIGAILIYNWKKGKDTQRKKDEEKVDVENGTPKSESASKENTSNTQSTSSSGSKGNDDVKREDWDKPTGFTKAQGDEFRAWFNDNYPEMAKAFKLDRTGEPDNSFIRLPYWKYKGEWNKYQQSKTPSSSTTNQEVLLKANQDAVQRLADAWGMTKEYIQLPNAPTGTMELKATKKVSGTNSVGSSRDYKIFLYAQESAQTKKSYWVINEYYSGGDYIGKWMGYFNLNSNGSMSFTVTTGQNSSNIPRYATNMQTFVQLATGAKVYG